MPWQKEEKQKKHVLHVVWFEEDLGVEETKQVFLSKAKI